MGNPIELKSDEIEDQWRCMNLYVVGGRQKHRWLWPVEAEHRFDLALILRLNTDTGKSMRVVEHETPAEVKADRKSSNIFAGGVLRENKLYICTYTEVIVFELPDFKRIAYLSLPRFNALHHVCPTCRGTVLVANTGLDMVLETTLEGSVVREWSVLDEPLWGRFSPTADYRKVVSTKPHRSHPNYVFEIQEDVWVTRFLQQDALCLTQPTRRIGIGIERPHDGLLSDGRLYFTTVDGHLVVADPDSQRILSTMSLRSFTAYPFASSAWCRGIYVIDKRTVCVGFTRIRKTALMRTGNWVKHAFREVDPPTHIAIFDLEKKRCLGVINLEPHGINLVFGIFNAEGSPLGSR